MMEAATLVHAELPPSVYVIVGVLVLSNLSLVIPIITFFFKAGITKATHEMGIKDAKETAIRCHKRVDVLEQINNKQRGIV
jgi:hypothetical protein